MSDCVMMAILCGCLTYTLNYRSGVPVIAGATIAALMAALVTYSNLPVMATDFTDPWVVGLFSILVGSAVTWGLGLLVDDPHRQGDAPSLRGVIIPVVGFVILFVVVFVASSPMFHARELSSILGDVPHVPFESAMQRLDLSGHPVAHDATVIDQGDVRLVDSVLAERRAQGLMGRDPEFGGTYAIGGMQLTRRQGRLVWAAPLEFRSLTRWWATSTSPGYVWVDAHDPDQAGLVKEAGGKPIAMRCLDSAWFGWNLERSIRHQGFHGTGLDEYSFEIGPDGMPFYVASTYVHRVGFGGSDPTGVVVLDPQTCEAAYHPMGKVPAWVNRVVPAAMVFHQVAWQGEYRHGWWNATWGAHADIVLPTPGIELVSTSRGGDTAWYMGLATSGTPNGTTGFMLIDSRDKKAVYFEQPDGVTEEGARDSIMGKIAEKRGWTSTWPILYNIGGRATYLVSIKDAAGNFKGVGMMPVDNRNLVVVSDDLPRALQAYQQLLAGHASGTRGVGGGGPSVTIDGKVVRLASEVIDGNTVHYLIMDSRQDIVLTATNRLGPQVALTQEGDHVSIRASDDTGSGTWAVQSMVNHGMSPVSDTTAPGGTDPR